jgi:hypothetical protein
MNARRCPASAHALGYRRFDNEWSPAAWSCGSDGSPIFVINVASRCSSIVRRGQLMHRTFRLVGMLAGAAAFACSLGAAGAQTASGQLQLTEKQIQAYVAAHKKLVAAREEIEKLAKSSGFESLAEYDDVGVNIMLVFDGLDPKTKAFTQPPGQIKKRMEDVKADKSLPDAERKQLLEDLGDSLKDAKPIQFPSNIELVKKYFDKIRSATE